MEDVLDYKESVIKPGKLFSIVGFGFAILTPFVLSKYYPIILDYYLGSTSTLNDQKTAILYSLLFCFSGLIVSSLSLVRKENLKFITPIGIALNAFWFLSWAMILYTYAPQFY